MNFRLLLRHLSSISWLIGAAMLFSLPWAWPVAGQVDAFESQGFLALLGSMAICFLVGWAMRYAGRKNDGVLYRKEAMAVVGLSWVLATLLGALPYLFSGTARGYDAENEPIRMSFIDCLFEAQSGFSTTGATVLTAIEDPDLVPRCILFWRSGTHFLGGLGIIVLFVAILGQGSAGKVLMRAEMPGPSKEGSQTRMQHTAWVFTGIYCLMNAVLAILLRLEGIDWFDSLCHAFGTLATGGFSTYDNSVGHFATVPGLNGPLIEMTIVVFMVLSGTNFTLLYYLLFRGQPGKLLADVEWRVYMTVFFIVTGLVVLFGLYHHDFANLLSAIRYSLFQVASIVSTTGYGTSDFDQWNSFSRGILFLLIYTGACAGSTSGGLKIIRHILLLKILWLEIERSFRPTVVRTLRLGGESVEDTELRHNVLVYFALYVSVVVGSWLLLITIEPDKTWTDIGQPAQNKLIDVASSIGATLNNVGPGLGVVGSSKNYARFTPATKLVFVMLMMVGRVEIFAIVVLFVPRFWRSG